MERDLFLRGSPIRGLEYATYYGHGSSVEAVAQAFDVACKAGQIKTGQPYTFNRASGRFVESSTGTPGVKTSPRPRSRLCIAQARERLRLAEFVVETDRRAQMVDLRMRAWRLR